MLDANCTFDDTFTDQETIDRRLTPCTEIRGRLTLTCRNVVVCSINNLQALRNVQHIDSLTIRTIAGITTLAGMEAVRTSNSISILDMNDLMSLSALMSSQPSGCSVDMASLIIKGNNQLTDLTGLDRIRTVGVGNPELGMTIEDNDMLASVQGLNCASRVSHLRILNNMVLTSVQALTSLTRVNGLSIQGNMVLESLEGLHNLISFSTILELSAPGNELINMEGFRGIEQRGPFIITSSICYQNGGIVTREHLTALPQSPPGFQFISLPPTATSFCPTQ